MMLTKGIVVNIVSYRDNQTERVYRKKVVYLWQQRWSNEKNSLLLTTNWKERRYQFLNSSQIRPLQDLHVPILFRQLFRSNRPITSSFKPLLIPVELPLTGQYLSKHNLGNKFSTPQNTLEIDRPLYTPRSYSRFPLEQTNSLSHLFKQKARCRYT